MGSDHKFPGTEAGMAPDSVAVGNNSGLDCAACLILTKGYHALVDTDDAEHLCRWKWSATVTTRGRVYACRKGVREDGKVGLVFMHRQLTGAPKGMDVDHVNNLGLDNRRANIRVVTRTQNNLNRQKVVGASKYKGVSRTRGGRWRAEIRPRGVKMHLGHFPTEEAAARAYNEAAARLYGPIVYLNIIPEPETDVRQAA